MNLIRHKNWIVRKWQFAALRYVVLFVGHMRNLLRE